MAMIEVYRGDGHREVSIYLPVTPIGGTMDVNISDSYGNALYEVNTITNSAGTYSFNLPFYLAQYDRLLHVDWEFDYVEDGNTHHLTMSTPVKVVTPLLSIAEVQALNPDLSDEDARVVEATVRHIITSITKQEFGYYVGPRTVLGNGDQSLRLPQRLLSVTSVETDQYTFNTYGFQIASDGWYLRQNVRSLLTVKEMPSEPSLDRGPVIQTPYASYYSGFRTNTNYTINGIWGYAAVPEPIRLAARLLVQDYACPEVVYRDKLLASIRSGDWAMQFSTQSYENTGNARADMLIDPYVLFDWALL